MTTASSSVAGSKKGTRALIGKDKLAHVIELLSILKDDLSHKKLRPEESLAALEQLKIYGREPKNAEPIFTKEGIEVLAKHGLFGTSSPSSLEALRCLANAMLLEPKTRQILVDLDYAGQAAERLRNEDSDNEFLISRILFLTTYESNIDFNPLLEDHTLGLSLNAHIARHAKQFTEGGETSQPNAFEQAALSESLKLLFNISIFYPNQIHRFTPSIEAIFNILNKIKIPNPPLQPPINYLINALINLDLSNHHAFPKSNPNTNLSTLTTILHHSLTTLLPTQLETLLTPLLTILHKLHASAPPPQKQHLASLLLPTESDRDLPLGKSNTLPSKLLNLTTSATSPNLREAISTLLFELSDRDANTFVRNVGYGFAAGFLLSHDIPVPEFVGGLASQRSTAGENGDVSRGMGKVEEDELVNPVTGQKLSKEEEDDAAAAVHRGSEMSEEEKEREAERLFVLFERLRATGVVGVGDPVREAVESGRFEMMGDGDGDFSGRRRRRRENEGGGWWRRLMTNES